MRSLWRWLLVLVSLAAIGIAAWWYVHRERLARQWHSYRVGAAESFEAAEDEIAWFETGPQPRARLGELVRKWGTGNQTFDLYLARYVDEATSGQIELLREVFSRELGRREGLLSRWAHYWSYRAAADPDEEIASVVAYLDASYSTEPPKRITWREVLDLKAVLHLTRQGAKGQGGRAGGISPENWREHYRVWQERRPAELPHVARPKQPFPPE